MSVQCNQINTFAMISLSLHTEHAARTPKVATQQDELTLEILREKTYFASRIFKHFSSATAHVIRIKISA